LQLRRNESKLLYMATVVVGGHSRNVGKTSVVAQLIAGLGERRWTAAKITQFGHGICSVDGEACDCAVDEHTLAISEEHDRSGKSDTSRFLLAGAERALWVRTRQGFLAEAMPALRARLEGCRNVILESNSVLKFLRPDLYLTVLDPATADFKSSAQEFIDLADAVILHPLRSPQPAWEKVSPALLRGKPSFTAAPPQYASPELVAWVREKLQGK
jgi:molybdopterin-guanine dinucleotide biosynthesis protein